MLRIVRAHGWDRNLDKRDQDTFRKRYSISPFYAQYSFYDLGYNLRPTEINGFIGNIQIKYINKIARKRFSNFKKFAKVLYGRRDRFLPIKYNHIDLLSNFAVPVLCRNEKIAQNIIDKCQNNIEIRPIIGGNITRQPFFKKYLLSALKDKLDLPNADFIHRCGLYFANNQDLTDEEIKYIISVFTS